MCVCVSTYCTRVCLCGAGAKSTVAPPGSALSICSIFFHLSPPSRPILSSLTFLPRLSLFPELSPWQQARSASQEISGSQAVIPVHHCGVQPDTLVLGPVWVLCCVCVCGTLKIRQYRLASRSTDLLSILDPSPLFSLLPFSFPSSFLLPFIPVFVSSILSHYHGPPSFSSLRYPFFYPSLLFCPDMSACVPSFPLLASFSSPSHPFLCLLPSIPTLSLIHQILSHPLREKKFPFAGFSGFTLDLETFVVVGIISSPTSFFSPPPTCPHPGPPLYATVVAKLGANTDRGGGWCSLGSVYCSSRAKLLALFSHCFITKFLKLPLHAQKYELC